MKRGFRQTYEGTAAAGRQTLIGDGSAVEHRGSTQVQHKREASCRSFWHGSPQRGRIGFSTSPAEHRRHQASRPHRRARPRRWAGVAKGRRNEPTAQGAPRASRQSARLHVLQIPEHRRQQLHQRVQPRQTSDNVIGSMNAVEGRMPSLPVRTSQSTQHTTMNKKIPAKEECKRTCANVSRRCRRNAPRSQHPEVVVAAKMRLVPAGTTAGGEGASAGGATNAGRCACYASAPAHAYRNRPL